VNSKALLLSYYSLLPPLRNETLKVNFVQSHEEAFKDDNSIYIKNTSNILIYLNKYFKFYEVYDDVRNSSQGIEAETLIYNIIESIKFYPRDYYLLTLKANNTKEKGRQFFLFDILPNKNLGVNTLRSIYVSYGYQN
jgi:hypothetical protein